MVLDEPIAGSPTVFDPMVPRILVVDDEVPVLTTIQGVLELDGYHVTVATSHAQALDLVRTQHFDVILTDLRLDGHDGIEILREVRQLLPEAVSIMLTGYASLDSAVKALREGAYDYLFKPCDVLELRMAVRRGLERSRLSAQLRERVRELEQANETIRALNLELEARVEQATAELRDQMSAKDEFMATVSHDLKSPLTFIKGMANLKRRRTAATAETEPLLDALEQIEASASRMAQQLDELVDASRLQAGRPLELRRDQTDLVALARQAVVEHQQTTDRHAIQIVSDPTELVGRWDGTRLARVLDNLLSNAVKYSPRGGAVIVNVGLDGNVAMLSVSDLGEGIPEADLPHVFEHFRRGRNVQGRIPGTGIGLAGVKRIVEQHGGSIGVVSQIGQGSTFTVRLPLREPTAS
jgi:signal transduction histidine kinase